MSNDKPRLGYIGMGLMGAPMTSRLLDAGYQVTIWNRSPEKMKPLLEKGAVAADGPKAVTEGSDIVMQCLTAAPAVDISDERDGVLETGGGLVRARPLLGEAPVFVTNTDAIFRADDPAEKGFPQLTEGFDPAKEDARLLLVRKDRALGLDTAGDFHLEPDGRLRRRVLCVPARAGAPPPVGSETER